MLLRVGLTLAMFVATPVWPQLGSTPFETPGASADGVRMQTPPPVSADSYPGTVGSQMRSNYLAGGLILTTAYNDNVLAESGTTPIVDVSYSILPTITFNQNTSRRQLTLTYDPGFTFYQHTSELNAANQIAALNFQFRPSQHMTISLNESFQNGSSVFDQLYSVSGSSISGSTLSSPTGVATPYGNRLYNTANAGINYQFSMNGMIGGSGIFTVNNYSNSDKASGLNNSNSYGGSAFFSQRLTSKQYIGVTYQYSNSQSNPSNAQGNSTDAQSEVHTHAVLAFYTTYLNPTLSLSLSAGPQHFYLTQSSLPGAGSWTPSVMASIAWQRSRTNLVASYSRTVGGGAGLLGAFNTNSANILGRWLITRTWTVGLGATYSINKNVFPSLSASSPGGHSVSGSAMAQHPIGEHLVVEFGYTPLHQSYNSIAIISEAPSSNREYLTVSYQFTRPLGR